MTRINNQTQDLFAIDSVQELTSESAAAVSGGAVVKTVTLYDGQNFKGKRLGRNNKVADLSRVGFDNITSSIQVQSGKWRFYDGKNFTGKSILINGETGLGRISLDNKISSFKAV